MWAVRNLRRTGKTETALSSAIGVRIRALCAIYQTSHLLVLIETQECVIKSTIRLWLHNTAVGNQSYTHFLLTHSFCKIPGSQ